MNDEEEIPQYDYDAFFREEAGHELTEQDHEIVRKHLLRELNDRHLGNEGCLTHTVKGAFDAYSTHLSEKELRRVFSSAAQESFAISREKKRQEEARRARWRKFGTTIAGFMLAGVFTGTATAVYTASRDPIVDHARLQYEERKAELEQRFYGPLDTLTTISAPSTLSPLERELYLLSLFDKVMLKSPRSLLENNQKSIYDQRIENIHIVARGTLEDELLLLKYDATGGIAEAYLFNGDGSDDMEEFIDDAEAVLSLIFTEEHLNVVRHRQKTISRIRQNRIEYVGDDISPYQKHVSRILQEFGTLYSRGPNLP
ncbi:hypothetical protein HY496_01220 [Candidatus Woesearchaeota archaeon]|nr:hypothetical protein [Candidatus Woesearchaeota archaeon]